MKYNIFSTIATVCAAGLMLSACMPEDYELGPKALHIRLRWTRPPTL